MGVLNDSTINLIPATVVASEAVCVEFRMTNPLSVPLQISSVGLKGIRTKLYLFYLFDATDECFNNYGFNVA